MNKRLSIIYIVSILFLYGCGSNHKTEVVATPLGTQSNTDSNTTQTNTDSNITQTNIG